jgi:hypothetical protein
MDSRWLSPAIRSSFQRLELGSEIHSRLKEAEQELELLRVEVEALETGSDSLLRSMDSRWLSPAIRSSFQRFDLHT